MSHCCPLLCRTAHTMRGALSFEHDVRCPWEFNGHMNTCSPTQKHSSSFSNTTSAELTSVTSWVTIQQQACPSCVHHFIEFPGNSFPLPSVLLSAFSVFGWVVSFCSVFFQSSPETPFSDLLYALCNTIFFPPKLMCTCRFFNASKSS